MINFSEIDLSEFSEEDKEKIKINYKLAFKKASSLRGYIIELFSILETNMEVLISDYFTSCHELKSQELIFALLGQEGFNFHNKRRLVIFIFENAFPHLIKKYKKLDTRIQRLNSFRNLMAHRKFDIRSETLLKFDGKSINLISVTTEKNKIHSSVKIIDEISINKEAQEIAKVTSIINEAILEIRNIPK